MALMEERALKNQGETIHNVILENRQRASISGVEDVDSFDEDEIRLFTQLGELTIKGKDLHINEISVESGDVSVEGDIWALVYGEKDRKKKQEVLTWNWSSVHSNRV